MSSLDTTPAFGKKLSQGLAGISSDDKNKRVARDLLRDLMLFNNVLEGEMRRVNAAVKQGASVDHQMVDKMKLVKEKYDYAMSGFKALDDEMERHAFATLADAIQDLMIYLHGKRGH